MKRIFLLAIALLILGSVGLFAQYTYDFEFDVICSSGFDFELWTQEHGGAVWVLVDGISRSYRYSQIIEYSRLAPPTIANIRITAVSPSGSYRKVHPVSLHGVNYFLIDLRTFLDPTPPNPMGGGE
jgi:hypothetical protein